MPKTETIKVTVRLPVTLYKETQHRAIDDDTTVTALIEQGLRLRLARKETR